MEGLAETPGLSQREQDTVHGTVGTYQEYAKYSLKAIEANRTRRSFKESK